MAKSHKTSMEQAEIIDTFGTYQTFTSDVSLPKDDKIAMPGEQIIVGQLTGLKMHRHANYAIRKVEVQLYGQYAKTSRPKSIWIYSLMMLLEISIQNISLVLSCE